MAAGAGGQAGAAGLAASNPSRQRWRLAGLALAVLVAHALLVSAVMMGSRLGDGRGDKLPARIDVAFVRELAPAAPPAAAATRLRAAPPAARLPAVAARRPRPAASAPAQGERVDLEPAPPPPTGAAAMPGAEPPPSAAATEVQPRAAVAEPASLAAAAAVEGGTASASPEANPARDSVAQPEPPQLQPQPLQPLTASFDWPPSTRLSYRLNGHYRGPVSGRAQVEWLRDGARYQVRMGTSIGPVLSRNITSEGLLTEQGLAPQRFDAEQKVLFRETRRWSLRFGPQHITLADGTAVPTLPGAQDEASQFVQLTWLFTTQPERLKVGQAVDMPLIINRNLMRWTYDVVAEELLHFDFGEIPSFHVKPRQAAQGGDLSAEIWFAPSLQNLPVRFLIRQNTESWVELTLERLPEQAQAVAR